MQRRQGFTLVELLVAMALTLFLMVILSEAFSAGLGAFRQLKAVCELQEKLRTVATIIRHDLQANYFDLAHVPGKRLHEVDLNLVTGAPPTAGFFRVWQGSATVNEGTDSDLLGSSRMGTTDQFLHFSIDLEQSVLHHRPDNYLSVLVPDALNVGPPDLQVPAPPSPGPYPFNSQKAEVVYFLGPNPTGSTGTTAKSGISGVSLFALYRRQLLAAKDVSEATYLNSDVATPPPRVAYTAPSTTYGPPQKAGYFEVSSRQDPNALGKLYFNSPSDLTIPERRFGMQAGVGTAGTPLKTGPFSYPTYSDQFGPTDPEAGDDIVLANVVSFSVQILVPAQSADFIDVAAVTGGNQNSGLPAGVSVFDTWSAFRPVPLFPQDPSSFPYDYTNWNSTNLADANVRVPLAVRVVAVQIILRVWDEKTERTRQITIVQDM
jgi:prepilin-type N-terminal cleavage/methylation domain-containing protein